MLNTLRNRLMLLVLPSVEVLVASLGVIDRLLDRTSDALQDFVASQAVRLAESGRARREAIESLNRAFDDDDARTVAAIRATQEKLRRAEDARNAVRSLTRD